MIEIGARLFSLTGIAVIASLQVVAWYMGFNGQMTILASSCIVGLIAFATGLKIDLKK